MKTRIPTRARWAVLISAGALIVTGCADTSADDGDKKDDAAKVDYSTRLINVKEASGQPAQGGTLRVAEYSEARTLNPTQTFPTGATGGNIMAAVYDTLVRYNHETDEFEGQLAESLESDDLSTWTLKLREGVKFHDGTALDAEAVIGSLQYYTASYGMNATLLKQEITSLTAVDAQTVKIELAHPWAKFPNMLASGAGMVLAPAAYKNPATFKPIGAGPFTFTSYAPAEKTVVTANPEYWDGRPALDAIEFVLLGTDSTAYETLQSGGVDVAFLRGSEVVDDVIKSDTPAMVNRQSMTINFSINNRAGFPGEDKRVRQAIALAIDPAIYLQRTANGAGDPTKLLISEDSPWAPGAEPMPTDTAAAKKLLEEAKADGYDGKISFLARTDQASQSGALAVQAMLEAVGFEVKLDLVQNVADQVQKIYIDHTFDIAAVAMSIPDEDVFTRLVSSLGSTSPTNTSGYASPEMDQLALQLQAVDDPAEAREVLTKVEALWAEDAPEVGISSGGMANAWNDDVHGLEPSAESMVLFGDAWIAK
ncbi:ABC transporter substrate-binding protein [Nocardioides speluncae]|uniref:ABC transporter substrate-binding protein n=1 Tax=Nocardioides speluncae TaxID=2670337 RepID=UPI00137B0F64|nr:ABC transporter substrate-binding protein [Nocardioides speluncae]